MSDREITELADVSENRLTWPPNKARTSSRSGSPFKQPQIDREEQRIKEELRRWRITRWMVSRNHQRIFGNTDPGVAVWWEDPKDHSLRVIACDAYRDLASNARAIYLTMDALRAIERWGAYTTEEATEGARYLALPPPEEPYWRVFAEAAGAPWSSDPRLPLPAYVGMYRVAAKRVAGDEAKLRRLNLAIEAARAAAKDRK
jgi:hypothetical protein